MKAVVRSAASLVGAHVLLASILTLVGLLFGGILMGEAWANSAPLLVLVAIDSVFVAAGTAPLAAHRSLWSSARLAQINTWIVLIRIPLVIVGAIVWGAQGAVTGLLAVTIGATISWWVSLCQLQRR